MVAGARAVLDEMRTLQPHVVHTHFSRFDIPALRSAADGRLIWHLHSLHGNRSAAVRLKTFVKYRLLGARRCIRGGLEGGCAGNGRTGACDVLAFPSYYERYGFVLAEALACGLPVAASDIPAVEEICDGVDTVVRCPVADGPALARALNEASAFGLGRWVEDILKLYDGDQPSIASSATLAAAKGV